jgi:hypothetical protein
MKLFVFRLRDVRRERKPRRSLTVLRENLRINCLKLNPYKAWFL